MDQTLARVTEIVCASSGISPERLFPSSAIHQDIRLSGDDIDELADRLSVAFGQDAAGWPWHRFTDLSEPHLFTAFGFLWRIISRAVRGGGDHSRPYERLELGHIAKVIDAGHWLEP